MTEGNPHQLWLSIRRGFQLNGKHRESSSAALHISAHNRPELAPFAGKLQFFLLDSQKARNFSVSRVLPHGLGTIKATKVPGNHHANLIGDGKSLILVMGDIDARDSLARDNFTQFDGQTFAHRTIQRRKRFIQEKKTRPWSQSAGQRHSLRLTA